MSKNKGKTPVCNNLAFVAINHYFWLLELPMNFEYLYPIKENCLMKYDAIIIGAGLTGLSTAFFLKRKGFNILVLEKNDRIGGAMCSHAEDGFVYEEGPNTGSMSNPELAELFELLDLEPENAKRSAEKRLILKNKKWYPLPGEAFSFFMTPLFSLSDKLKIPFEPFRKKGNNPDESIAEMASRRIGQSFVDYAVNPFISGIYAGDPEKLVTRYALPKLYNLEQQYGSFIGGAFKKSQEPKTERDKKASKKVFSAYGGFSTLINRLGEKIGYENIMCNALSIQVEKSQDRYYVNLLHNGKSFRLESQQVISTVGSYSLPEIFPFIDPQDMDIITELRYAKIIQIAVGVERKAVSDDFISFGGLIPQKEDRRILGALLPSFCFEGRAPEEYTTFAIYMGGMRHPEYIDMPDKEIEKIIKEELDELFHIPESSICFMKIYRHPYAIPQYEKSSGKRFEIVEKIEQENPGLIIAGNLRNGIGIADRVKQAFTIAENIQ